MPKAKATYLVIDANIMRSAGGEETESQTSLNCTDCLDLIKERKYKIALSEILLNEWDKHFSSHSANWFKERNDKGKVEMYENIENEELREKIAEAAEGEDIEKILMKDVHLLELALKTDRKILSLEKQCLKHFKEIVPKVKKISKIFWSNPDKPGDKTLEWLKKMTTETDFEFLMIGHSAL